MQQIHVNFFDIFLYFLKIFIMIKPRIPMQTLASDADTEIKILDTSGEDVTSETIEK